jgi:hypothetical protein
VRANGELECITPQLRAHPDVLHVRYRVYAAAKKWEIAAEIAQAIAKRVPGDSFGFVHLAYSLHELKRTKEAQEVLLPIVDKFPDRYNLACYACQLRELKEGRRWLEKAIDLADTKEVKLMALNDPDLEPLWVEISDI